MRATVSTLARTAWVLLSGVALVVNAQPRPLIRQSLTMEMTPTVSATTAVIMNPACIPKYQDDLVLPPVMPTSSTTGNYDIYNISARPLTQNVLPTNLGACGTWAPTRVFGYGTVGPSGPTHNWPGFTIEARRNRWVRVTWRNELVTATGQFVPHVVADSIDQTLHWANPNKIGGKTDSSPCMMCSMPSMNNCNADTNCITAANAAGYQGPVPIVTHIHGNSLAYDFSDGWSEAWYLPNANNIPAGYARVGSWYDTFNGVASRTTGQPLWDAGTATFTYRNVQNAAQLWYHDHVVGLTRLNVYAGLAGLYNLREVDVTLVRELPGIPWPPKVGTFTDTQVREIPIAIQDRVFDTNSQLYYPKNGLTPAEKLPAGAVPPIWIPEFLDITTDGNPGGPSAVAMIVNGKTWPKFTVKREPYRLRFLNGCNARTIIFYLSTVKPTGTPPVSNTGRLDMYVIGNEAGFFPTMVGPKKSIMMGPAERYDVIVDFSQIPATGGPVYLLNEGPEVPYNGVNNLEGLQEHQAELMMFDVQSGAGASTIDAVKTLLEPALRSRYRRVSTTSPAPARKRKFTLVENADLAGNVVAVLLGQATVNTAGENVAIPKTWSDDVTTAADPNTVEEWDMINLTVDSHPIHIHETFIQIVNQTQLFVRPSTSDPTKLTWTDTGIPVNTASVNKEGIYSAPCGSTLSSTCVLQKDTYMVPPQTKVTFRLKTNGPGLFPWHCHLLEHEDNEMMRPWCVGQPGYFKPGTSILMCPTVPGIPPL